MNKSLFAKMVLTLCLISNSSFAEESLSDFANRINRLTAPVDQAMQAYAACANGNDNACIAINVNPADPCRPYLTSSPDMYNCRAQQQANQLMQQQQQNNQSGDSPYGFIDRRISEVQQYSNACNAGNQEACAILQRANQNAERMGRYADEKMKDMDRANRMRQSQDAAETRRKMLDKSWIGSDGIERHYDPE